MVHISLDTHGTFYLFVCAVNVYICTFLGNEISIYQSKTSHNGIMGQLPFEKSCENCWLYTVNDIITLHDISCHYIR